MDRRKFQNYSFINNQALRQMPKCLLNTHHTHFHATELWEGTCAVDLETTQCKLADTSETMVQAGKQAG